MKLLIFTIEDVTNHVILRRWSDKKTGSISEQGFEHLGLENRLAVDTKDFSISMHQADLKASLLKKSVGSYIAASGLLSGWRQSSLR